MCLQLIIGEVYCTTSQTCVQFAEANRWLVGKLVDGGFPTNSQEFMISSLLPPPESVFASIDNNLKMGQDIYINYLVTRQDIEPSMCQILSNIIARPSKILLYTDDDANKQFHILDTLNAFFMNSFGFSMGLMNEQGIQIPFNKTSNPNVNANIADILFRNGCINREQYADMFPPDQTPSIRSCGLLLQSVNYGFNNMEEYLSFCKKMLAGIRETKNDDKISPVMFIK